MIRWALLVLKFLSHYYNSTETIDTFSNILTPSVPVFQMRIPFTKIYIFPFIVLYWHISLFQLFRLDLIFTLFIVTMLSGFVFTDYRSSLL